MATTVDAATALVVIVKVALEAPAGTVTLAGTAATPALLVESETTTPPVGAGPLRFTTPAEDCEPPITLVGLSVSDERVSGGGATVSDVDLLAPP